MQAALDTNTYAEGRKFGVHHCYSQRLDHHCKVYASNTMQGSSQRIWREMHVCVWNYRTVDQALPAFLTRTFLQLPHNVTMTATYTAEILQYWTIILYFLNVITLHVKNTQKLPPYFIVLQLLNLMLHPSLLILSFHLQFDDHQEQVTIIVYHCSCYD